MYVCMYIYMLACMNLGIYVYKYTYKCVCKYIYSIFACMNMFFSM